MPAEIYFAQFSRAKLISANFCRLKLAEIVKRFFRVLSSKYQLISTRLCVHGQCPLLVVETNIRTTIGKHFLKKNSLHDRFQTQFLLFLYDFSGQNFHTQAKAITNIISPHFCRQN